LLYVLFSAVTEIRFIDVDLLQVGKDFLEVELFEFIKHEVEAIFVQFSTCPPDLVHLTHHADTPV